MSEPRATYTVTEWHGCYNDSWNGVIVPEAFAHPAKFARGLIHRIYQHMLERGYIAPGDSVIDPFGGIAAGAYDALLFGLHWTGCELEPRFVELGNRNIEKYLHDLRMLNGRLGTARLLQGDSRRLVEVVGGGMGAAVSSPPYSTEALGHSRGENGEAKERELAVASSTSYGSTPGQLGSMPSGDYAAAVGSPPFVDQLPSHDDFQPPHDSTARLGVNYETAYGNAPGQLGTMKPGDFTAAVSSPPYSDMIDGSGEGPGARHDTIFHNGDNAYKASSANGYGDAPGNLCSMAGEGFEAAVGSPPFENNGVNLGGVGDTAAMRQQIHDSVKRDEAYGSDPANIGNDTGDTFWAAARVIVEQTYQALRPGGYAAWVTKRFVRKGQIVEFSDQWAQLCEAVGFVRVEWVRAMLTEEHGTQLGMFGEDKERRKERKSFFRRLAEKNGSPRIDYEDVIIMRRPLFEATP